MRQIACFLWLTLPLAAQTAQDRGKRVIDEAVQALGGQAFRNMKDRVEMGRAYSFYREELSGLAKAKLYTRYLTPPDPPSSSFIGVRERQAFGSEETAYVLLGEDYGYDVTYRGARPLPAPAQERFRESTLRNIFYILRQRLNEPGMSFESKGTDVVDNSSVETVEIIDPDNRQITVYFHRITKLPIKQITLRREPNRDRPVEEVTLFSKYRDVGGGVMWPFVIQRERDGEKVFSLYSEIVQINQNLTDNMFTLPSETKVIDKKKK
jgi:hypothetical protein